jgi:transposase
MDKGFYSLKNIEMLLKHFNKYKFLISIPFTTTISRDIVSKGFDFFDQSLMFKFSDDNILGYSYTKDFDINNKLKYHVFFNENIFNKKKKEEYDRALDLLNEASIKPELYINNKDCLNCLKFKKSKLNGAYEVLIDVDKINMRLKDKGWMILVSNDLDINYKDALKLYMNTDIVKKGFCRLKNNLDLNSLRIHDDSRLQGKLFISMLALIINSYIENVVNNDKLLNQFTIDQILKELSKIKLIKSNEKSTLTPISKLNRMILTSFGYNISNINA